MKTKPKVPKSLPISTCSQWLIPKEELYKCARRFPQGKNNPSVRVNKHHVPNLVYPRLNVKIQSFPMVLVSFHPKSVRLTHTKKFYVLTLACGGLTILQKSGIGHEAHLEPWQPLSLLPNPEKYPIPFKSLRSWCILNFFSLSFWGGEGRREQRKKLIFFFFISAC